MSLIAIHRAARSIGGLLLLASCGDGTSPSLEGADVRIYLDGSRYDEQTIGVGSTIVLEADVYDATGKLIEGHSFQWSSDNPAIASVTQAGVVTGLTVGTTRVIARHEVGEDTALVNVAEALSGAPNCTAGSRTFAIGTPEVFEGGAAASICLPGSADYSMVVVNTGTTAGARLQTRVTASGVRSPFGPPSPYLAPEPTPARLSLNDASHQRMRAEASARLEPRLQAGVDALWPTAPQLQASPGQILNFNVDGSLDGCSEDNIVRRGTRVRVVTDHAIIVEDTLNPAGGFTTADYQQFGDLFDDEIWPLVTSTFGEPTDIDNNGKVFILFTMAVNQRPENSSPSGNSYVGGFFFNRDLFPTSGRSACKGSNAGEMFYMLVPDPTGVVGRTFSLQSVRDGTPGVLVHEFQHLVNDSRRLHVTKSLVWEETWLNEGLSHVAEELMFFHQAGLQPRQNLNAGTFRDNPGARAEFDRFQVANLDRLGRMLTQPSQSSLMGLDALETRGAAWFFLRYMADRRGGDETALWRALVRDARTSGLENIRLVLGEDPRSWIADWAAAVYLDDSGLSVPSQFQVSSWNFRSIYPESSMWGLFYQQYPLQVLPVSTSASGQSYSLQGGSAVYLRTGVISGGMGALRVTVGNLPPPSRLKAIVTRLR